MEQVIAVSITIHTMSIFRLRIVLSSHLTITQSNKLHALLESNYPSEMAVADWENTLKRITQLYNESPLRKRSGSLLKFVDLLVKLMGMNTDHCAKEKKNA